MAGRPGGGGLKDLIWTTTRNLPGFDAKWAAVCRAISTEDNSHGAISKEAVAYLKKILKNREETMTSKMLTLRLLDACCLNCGERFQQAVAATLLQRLGAFAKLQKMDAAKRRSTPFFNPMALPAEIDNFVNMSVKLLAMWADGAMQKGDKTSPFVKCIQQLERDGVNFGAPKAATATPEKKASSSNIAPPSKSRSSVNASSVPAPVNKSQSFSAKSSKQPPPSPAKTVGKAVAFSRTGERVLEISNTAKILDECLRSSSQGGHAAKRDVAETVIELVNTLKSDQSWIERKIQESFTNGGDEMEIENLLQVNDDLTKVLNLHDIWQTGADLPEPSPKSNQVVPQTPPKSDRNQNDLQMNGSRSLDRNSFATTAGKPFNAFDSGNPFGAGAPTFESNNSQTFSHPDPRLFQSVPGNKAANSGAPDFSRTSVFESGMNTFDVSFPSSDPFADPNPFGSSSNQTAAFNSNPGFDAAMALDENVFGDPSFPVEPVSNGQNGFANFSSKTIRPQSSHENENEVFAQRQREAEAVKAAAIEAQRQREKEEEAERQRQREEEEEEEERERERIRMEREHAIALEREREKEKERVRERREREAFEQEQRERERYILEEQERERERERELQLQFQIQSQQRENELRTTPHKSNPDFTTFSDHIPSPALSNLSAVSPLGPVPVTTVTSPAPVSIFASLPQPPPPEALRRKSTKENLSSPSYPTVAMAASSPTWVVEEQAFDSGVTQPLESTVSFGQFSSPEPLPVAARPARTIDHDDIPRRASTTNDLDIYTQTAKTVAMAQPTVVEQPRMPSRKLRHASTVEGLGVTPSSPSPPVSTVSAEGISNSANATVSATPTTVVDKGGSSPAVESVEKHPSSGEFGAGDVWSFGAFPTEATGAEWSDFGSTALPTSFGSATDNWGGFGFGSSAEPSPDPKLKDELDKVTKEKELLTEQNKQLQERLSKLEQQMTEDRKQMQIRLEEYKTTQREAELVKQNLQRDLEESIHACQIKDEQIMIMQQEGESAKEAFSMQIAKIEEELEKLMEDRDRYKAASVQDREQIYYLKTSLQTQQDETVQLKDQLKQKTEELERATRDLRSVRRSVSLSPAVTTDSTDLSPTIRKSSSAVAAVTGESETPPMENVEPVPRRMSLTSTVMAGIRNMFSSPQVDSRSDSSPNLVRSTSMRIMSQSTPVHNVSQSAPVSPLSSPRGVGPVGSTAKQTVTKSPSAAVRTVSSDEPVESLSDNQSCPDTTSEPEPSPPEHMSRSSNHARSNSLGQSRPATNEDTVDKDSVSLTVTQANGSKGEELQASTLQSPESTVESTAETGNRETLRRQFQSVPGISSSQLAALQKSVEAVPLSKADRFRLLCQVKDGVLYEDDTLRIEVKSEYRTFRGKILLIYENKSGSDLDEFNVDLGAASSDAVRFDLTPTEPTLLPDSPVTQQLLVECYQPFKDSPTLRVSFRESDGGSRAIKLIVPLIVSKFMVPSTTVTQQNFFSKWSALNGPAHETVVVMDVHPRLQSMIDISKCFSLGGSIGLLHGLDKNPNNLVGTSTFHQISPIDSALVQSISCLIRFELGSGPMKGKARVTVRSDDKKLGEALIACLGLQLSAN